MKKKQDNERSKRWRKANPERVRAMAKRSHENHKEARSIGHKKWYLENRERIIEEALIRAKDGAESLADWYVKDIIEKKGLNNG